MFLLVTNRGQHIAVGQSAVVGSDVTFCTKQGTSDLQYAELDPEEAARVQAELQRQGRLD